MSEFLKKEFPSIIEQLARLGEPIQHSIWCPYADIYQEPTGWLIKLELAGVCLEDIKISLIDTNLKIEGVRRDLIACKAKQAYKMEISYNRFERVIELPEKLINAQVSMEFDQGMLMIHVQREVQR